MPVSLFLAMRLVRRRGTALLRTSALAALCAVALGVASLVVVLALMSGYTSALQKGILAASGDLLVLAPDGLSDERERGLAEEIRRLEGVTGVGAVAYLPGLLSHPGGRAQVMTLKATGVVPFFATLPAAGGAGPLPVSLGSGVARRLAASPGSRLLLQVVVGGGLRTLPVVVAQVFHTGFTELDDGWAVARMATVRGRLGALEASGLEVWVSNLEDVDAYRAPLEAVAGRALVTTWEESSHNLFAALRWQKLSLGVVLSLVLGVGAFEVASALVVLVTEKRRTLGVLLALGGDPRLVRRTFFTAGAALGALGVIAGVGLGLLLVGFLAVARIPSFPADIASIYGVDHIPMLVRLPDIAAVLALGLLEVCLASLFPAYRAASRDPVEVLRWV